MVILIIWGFCLLTVGIAFSIWKMEIFDHYTHFERWQRDYTFFCEHIKRGMIFHSSHGGSFPPVYYGGKKLVRNDFIIFHERLDLIYDGRNIYIEKM